MNVRIGFISILAIACVGTAFGLFLSEAAFAHCDTLDGPVVAEAKAALEQKDVTPVLKWVKPEHEAEIRDAFEKTLVVRTKGPEAKQLADMYFFETLVRIHRAGEGAPYTGLKPAGLNLGPAVVGADKALETGEIDSVVVMLTNEVVTGIQVRFHKALEKKKTASESVKAGREFVAAYVEFVHYVERLHLDATTSAVHHEPAGEAAKEVAHEH